VSLSIDDADDERKKNKTLPNEKNHQRGSTSNWRVRGSKNNAPSTCRGGASTLGGAFEPREAVVDGGTRGRRASERAGNATRARAYSPGRRPGARAAARTRVRLERAPHPARRRLLVFFPRPRASPNISKKAQLLGTHLDVARGLDVLARGSGPANATGRGLDVSPGSSEPTRASRRARARRFRGGRIMADFALRDTCGARCANRCSRRRAGAART
jgi:hypothetical protein